MATYCSCTALDAATDGLTAEVERNAERIWSWTIKFGGATPLEKAVGAEVEATWAGALWLRRPLRLQVGAQLLNGEATHPAQWGHGVVMWTLGGGKRPERIFRLAEPHLDQAAVELVVRNLHDTDWPRSGPYRLVTVANEASDCLSDDTLRWLVDLFEPQAGEDSSSARCPASGPLMRPGCLRSGCCVSLRSRATCRPRCCECSLVGPSHDCPPKAYEL